MENERRLAKLRERIRELRGAQAPIVNDRKSGSRAVFPIPPPVDGLHQGKLDDVAWHCYTDADGGMWLTLRGQYLSK